MLNYPYSDSFLSKETADSLFKDIWENLPWVQHPQSPRKECWMNDTLRPYTYGKSPYERSFTAVEWFEPVRWVREYIFAETNVHYEGCFVNGYTGENDWLNWHSDNDPGIDHTKPIAIVSLGQPRILKTKTIAGDEKQDHMLSHGSLLLMPPGSQFTHMHKIPKAGRKVNPRISLTFRGLLL